MDRTFLTIPYIHYPRATRCGGDIVKRLWFHVCVCVCVRPSVHLVNTIQTTPLRVSLSNLADMLTMMRGTLLILEVRGQTQRSRSQWTYGNKLVNTIETKPLCISLSNLADLLTVMIFVRYLSEIRYFESRKPIIPTGFRYCVKLHFRHFRFRFLSGWSCFNGLVRNLNLECAWRKSYHSMKRIINPAFLSQCGHGWLWRFTGRLKPGQFVKEFNVQDM